MVIIIESIILIDIYKISAKLVNAMGDGVTGNTPDFDSGDSRFEP